MVDNDKGNNEEVVETQETEVKPQEKNLDKKISQSEVNKIVAKEKEKAKKKNQSLQDALIEQEQKIEMLLKDKEKRDEEKFEEKLRKEAEQTILLKNKQETIKQLIESKVNKKRVDDPDLKILIENSTKDLNSKGDIEKVINDLIVKYPQFSKTYFDTFSDSTKPVEVSSTEKKETNSSGDNEQKNKKYFYLGKEISEKVYKNLPLTVQPSVEIKIK